MEDGAESASVGQVLEGGWSAYEGLSAHPRASPAFEEALGRAVGLLERASSLASSLGVFSANEPLDDVPTPHLRFFLLPALLADLTQKRVSVDRIEALNVAEIYYRDFLKRCSEYEIIDIPIPSVESEKSRHSDHQRPLTLDEMTRNREAKIKQYKQQKEFEKKLKNLEEVVNKPGADDEVVRDYYLTLIKKWTLTSLEEISNIEMEKHIVAHSTKVKAEEEASGAEKEKASRDPPRQPLKPIIITRNEVQKTIYGLGYPALPTMTIEEFFEEKLKTSPANRPTDPGSLMTNAMAGLNREEEREKELIEKEKQSDRDDLEALKHQRELDDWKDDNRRGCGNRKNMG